MSSFYEKLPVYKKALDLVVYIEKIVQNFSRYHKYTVGTELRNLSRRILTLVAKANAKQERKATLLEIIEKLEEFKILVRRRVINSMKTKLRHFERSKYKAWKALRDSIQSYLGHFKWANSYNLVKKLGINKL